MLQWRADAPSINGVFRKYRLLGSDTEEEVVVMNIVELAVGSLLGFFLLYLCTLSVLALFVPRRRFPEPRTLRRFAFVVPAHDEEMVIERTVRSLFAVDYPRHCFDVVVVADNCRDDTARRARNCGAIVLERTNPTQRGKGYALRWCFDALLDAGSGYHAVVVIDADSVVSGNFLKVINDYCEQGCGAIQAADLAAPKPGVWSSEVSRVSLTLYNFTRPLGRKLIGCSAGLRGNGMCFTSETLRTVPWRAHSLTEDLEYGLLLLLHGIPTVFAPEASAIATMPAQSKHAESQRARWEAGRIPVVRTYVPLFMRRLGNGWSWVVADALIELLTPAFVNMAGIVLMVMALKTGAYWFGFEQAFANIGLWLSLFGIAVLYVVVGLRAANADPLLFKAVLYFPIYFVWKLRLYLKLAYHGMTKEWVRTMREPAQ